MRYITLIFITLLQICCAVALAADENITDPNKPIVVTKSSPKVIIKLKSNPTTGYSWFLKDYDPRLLVLVKHSFQAPTQKMPGAPGVEIWNFRLNPPAFFGPHLLEIGFVYARPWDIHDNSTRTKFTILTKKS